MGKCGGVMLIAIVMVATITPITGCGSYNCPPKTHPPNTRPPSGPGTPSGGGKSCPIDALKLGACVDLLGGLVHVGIGDPVVNQCCPVVQGVLGLEAALCLCTTIRAKVLNLNIYLPLALELLVSCGVKPPAGFKCPSN
eukprot:Gb_09669 [translate_table: standard]